MDVATVAADLQRLRKGRGAQAGQSIKRVGPALRTVCRIGEDACPVAVITRVAEWLRDASTALPDDLRISALGAFGLHEQTRGLLFYQERVQWIATQLDRDPRTARRRIDRAIADLAALAVRREQPTPVDLAGYIGQRIVVAWSPSGTSTANQTIRRGRLLALARSLDQDGPLAIVDLLDEAGTVAIPTPRMVSVSPLDQNKHRGPTDILSRSAWTQPRAGLVWATLVSDLVAAQAMPCTHNTHPASEQRSR